jgi:hypothetical protein
MRLECVYKNEAQNLRIIWNAEYLREADEIRVADMDARGEVLPTIPRLLALSLGRSHQFRLSSPSFSFSLFPPFSTSELLTKSLHI